MQKRESISYRMNLLAVGVFIFVFIFVTLSATISSIWLGRVDRVMESNEVVRNFWEALTEEEQCFENNTEDDTAESRNELQIVRMKTDEALDRIRFTYGENNADQYLLAQSQRRAFYRFRELQENILGSENGSDEYQSALSKYDVVRGYLNQYTEKLEIKTLEQGNRYYYQRRIWLYMIPLTSVIAGALIIFMMASVSHFLSRTIIAPIIRLSKESRKISQKDFSGEPMHADGEDEISILINSFEEMKNSTKKYITTMEEKHQVEKQLVETRYQMLKHQINPHFLFNTLNLISATAEIEDAKTTEKMINTLSRLTRYNLKSQTAVMPLNQEVKVVADYMYLQRMRFGAKIRFSTDIAAETRDVLIPSFVLQPIVENAVVHGISLLSKGGRVHIRTWIKDGLVWISIADTGVGIEEENCRLINEHIAVASAENAAFFWEHSSSGNGIGMTNVAERIQGMYANSGMHIYSKKDHGTIVQMYFEEHFREF